MKPTRSSRGFTLIELMVVVAILGILSAVAIPALVRYLRRAKSVEAIDKLAYLFRQSTTYWTAERYGRGTTGTIRPGQFPDPSPITPSPVSPGRRVTEVVTSWDTPGWNALTFAITDPHYYSYQYDSTGTGSSSMFTARALGDLDGDGTYSTFERAGASTVTLEVQGSTGLYLDNELE